MESIKSSYEILNDYEKYKGTQTSMITMYITKKDSLNVLLDRLCDDLQSKANIKKPENRKNTIAAVENIIRMVKTLWSNVNSDHIDVVYPNGILLLSGVLVDGNLVFAFIEPPEEIKASNYHNESFFVLN